MNILVLGLNYAPEPVGIGPYTAGMARALAAAGHRVSVVAGKPYYPQWKGDPAFQEHRYIRSMEHGVDITRCPIYVPSSPGGAKRIFHYASFAIAALPIMLARVAAARPDVVIAVAPSLMAAPVARVAAKLSGAKLWLHVQDFEVEAAFATGLIDERGYAAKVARKLENWALVANRVSTISPQMCLKLIDKHVPAEQIFEFRNWANIDQVGSLLVPSAFRAEWNIGRKHVALYSGNIARKQGIEIITEAAGLLAHRSDLLFVICGNGTNREQMSNGAAHLGNIRFFDLQPQERLSELLGLATVHLLPQIAGAADLVLPSKLTNMLASGRPVVATAASGTGLADEVEGCGLIVPPGDAPAFAAAIEKIIDDPIAAREYGCAARIRAEQRWSKDKILRRFEKELSSLVDSIS